jgi:hypothetical protein
MNHREKAKREQALVQFAIGPELKQPSPKKRSLQNRER